MKRIAERILCPDCHGAGETYFASRNHPGFAASNDCDRCDGEGEVDFDVATLAHNLAVAAFGAAMFRAGDNFGFHMGSDETQCTCQWSPGCGEPYRKSNRCEQEEAYDEPDDDLFGDGEWPDNLPVVTEPDGYEDLP